MVLVCIGILVIAGKRLSDGGLGGGSCGCIILILLLLSCCGNGVLGGNGFSC